MDIISEMKQQHDEILKELMNHNKLNNIKGENMTIFNTTSPTSNSLGQQTIQTTFQSYNDRIEKAFIVLSEKINQLESHLKPILRKECYPEDCVPDRSDEKVNQDIRSDFERFLENIESEILSFRTKIVSLLERSSL